MLEKGFTSYSQAYLYYIQQVQKISIANGRIPVTWEEVFVNFQESIDKRSIIQVWIDHATLPKVVQKGFRAILSNNDAWYLNRNQQQPWTYWYLNEPFQGISNVTQQQLVLGGEACMWTLNMWSSDVLRTIWPKTAAVAERLWSKQSTTDTVAAEPRYHWFRCLLLQRGVDASPVYALRTMTPSSCMTQ